MSSAPAMIAGRSISNYFGTEAEGRQDGAFERSMQRTHPRFAAAAFAIDCGEAARGYHGGQQAIQAE
jgi:hypothetical protein